MSIRRLSTARRPALPLLLFVFLLSSPAAAQVTVDTFTIPTEDSRPTAITLGPEGNLWFIESATDIVGRITPRPIRRKPYG